MFRSKRTSLLKRLWKQRVTEHEASCPSQSSQDIDLKSVLNSMLKRLKEGQLEVLSQAVETKGADKTPCVLLPKEDIRSGRLTAPPHFLCCQVWRWPDLDPSQQLKKLPCCTAGDQTQVCCNPYHWSRLYAPDCPPPSYTEALQERVKPLEDPEASVVSTETGGTPSELRLTYITVGKAVQLHPSG